MEPFTARVKKMTEEVRDLKTCPIKTATQLATKKKSINISMPMTVHPGTSPSYAYSYKRAYITATSSDGSNMLTSCTLQDNAGDVEDHNLLGRAVSIFSVECGSAATYSAVVYSRNYNDIQTITGGGTLVLNYTIDFICTSDFMLSVRYEDFNDE